MENGRKFFKQVENTVGKGEIACYVQFPVFPQCFQKACFPGASKGIIVWEWVNSSPNNPEFYRPWRRGLLKTMWKEEKMLLTNIFSFPHNVFYTSQNKTNFNFQFTFVFSSANAFDLDMSKILLFGSQLMHLQKVLTKVSLNSQCWLNLM